MEEIVDSSNTTQMSVSFAGCGFLGIYHVGVASCLQEYAPHLWSGKVAGASARALAACALITGCDLGKSTNYVLKIATEARSRALGPLHPSFNVVQRLRVGLESFLPANAHQIASGRLHISLTRVSDCKNVLVSQYNSKEELIQALICSAFVPFYCGLVPPKFQGVRYVDGGLTDNIPVLDESTVTVSPFAGESDICPNDCSSNFAHISLAGTSIQFTRANLYRLSRSLFPPHPEILSCICQQGFDDALKFLQRNNLISCTRHLNLKSNIYATKSGLDLFESDDVSSSDSESAYSSESDRPDVATETATHFYCGDDEDSEDDDLCSECHQRKAVALVDTLPPPVVTALQNACDSVNKGLLAPLYRTRLFRTVSLMTAPWILPFDITIEMARRLVDWVPYMPGDMHWFVNEMLRFFGDLYQLLQSSGQHATRFSCQLAITEYGNISRQSSRIWHGFAGKKSIKSLDKAPVRRNVNLDFAVDFRPTAGAAPLKLNKIRQQLTSSKGHHHHIRLHDVAEESEVAPSSASPVLASSGHVQKRYGLSSSSQDGYNLNAVVGDSAYDTFDNYLHVVNQMDSILSFYYMEGNRVRVTEIFALDSEKHRA